MSSPALIGAIEHRNELRAKQATLAGDEWRYALKVQQSIRLQAALEDQIMECEVYIAKLKAEEAVKTSDSHWLMKKLGIARDL